MRNILVESLDVAERDEDKLNTLEEIIENNLKIIHKIESSESVPIFSKRNNEGIKKAKRNVAPSSPSRFLGNKTRGIEIGGMRSLGAGEFERSSSIISKDIKPYTKLLEIIQVSADIDKLIPNFRKKLDKITTIQDKFVNKLIHLCDGFEDDVQQLEKNRKTSIDVQNQINNYKKETDYYFELLEQKNVADLNIENLSTPTFLQTILSETPYNYSMIIDSSKCNRISEEEINAFVNNFKSRKISKNNFVLNHHRVPDLRQSNTLSLPDLLDLVLETQNSLNNPLSLLINNCFLTSYFYFISTTDLLKYLTCKFCAIYPSDQILNEKAIQYAELVRFQVISLINQFIFHCDVIFSIYPKEKKLIEDFVQNIISIWYPDLSIKLLSLLVKEENRFLKTLNLKKLQLLSPISSSILSPLNPLLSSPREFANHLTAYEHKLFSNIQTCEFLSQNWNKRKEITMGINQNTKHFNSIVNWIVRTILALHSSEERGKTFRFFITSAMFLYKLNNFNGLFEIISALNDVSIFRLNLSWHAAGMEFYLIFRKLSSLIDKNYELYREELEYIQLPVTPYIGVFLTDLTFIEDANPTFIENNVNFFFKFGKIYEILCKIELYQSVLYDGFTVSDEWDYFFKNLISYEEVSEDFLYEKSIELESISDTNSMELPSMDEKVSIDSLRALRFHSLIDSHHHHNSSSSSSSLSLSSSASRIFEGSPIKKRSISKKSLTKRKLGISRGEKDAAKKDISIEQLEIELKSSTNGIQFVEKTICDQPSIKIFSGEAIVSWIEKKTDLSRSNSLIIAKKMFHRGIFISIDEIDRFSDDSTIWFRLCDTNIDAEVENKIFRKFSPRAKSKSLRRGRGNTLSEFEGKATDADYLFSVVVRMKHPQSGITIRHKKQFMRKQYTDCFSGGDCVAWLLQNIDGIEKEEVLELANNILAAGMILHLGGIEPNFKDKKTAFYRFADIFY